MSVFLALHIIGATLGQLLALAACVVALVYLWQRQKLKNKTFYVLSSRVPALDQLEKILLVCLWTGFGFISLALASGVYYFFRQGTYSSQGIEKFIWASTVWLWYLATLVMKSVYAQPSRRIAQMSLVGFVLLGAAVFGLLFMIIR
jgi:ABC-type uncharacterized transport system permease subunit